MVTIKIVIESSLQRRFSIFEENGRFSKVFFFVFMLMKLFFLGGGGGGKPKTHNFCLDMQLHTTVSHCDILTLTKELIILDSKINIVKK